MTSRDVQEIEILERDMIRSAAFDLPRYELLLNSNSDTHQTLFTLKSPAGKRVASMIACTGNDPWILIMVPFSPERTLQECVLARKEKTIGFLLDPNEFTARNEVEVDDSISIRRIWNELPPPLQQLPDLNIPLDRKLARCILCFAADAYRKINDLEYPAPLAEGARDRFLAKIAQEGMPHLRRHLG